jgi:hypothetical protein
MSDKKCPNCGYQLDSWNDCVSINNILECPECEEHFELKAIRLNKPQLTIPKSIADELDKRWEAQNKYLQRKIAVPRDAFYNVVNPYDNQLAATKIGEWMDENQSICFAYLAGKALGVDLVKVVEG